MLHSSQPTHAHPGTNAAEPPPGVSGPDQPAASGARTVAEWRDQPVCLSLYPGAVVNGPAYGTQHTDWPWSKLVAMLSRKRRQGPKDGACMVLAQFEMDPGGPNQRVRRQAKNLRMRTAVALDIETNKQTGAVPPSVTEAIARIEALHLSAVVYTSHSHTPDLPRFRVVVQITEPVACHLPVVEVMADLLGLADVLDSGKLGAASVFYWPSAPPGSVDHHEIVDVKGRPVDAAWLERHAGVLLAQREAEKAKLRAAAMEAAVRRRATQIARGRTPGGSVIEAIRPHLDVEEELLRHGYTRASDWASDDRKYLYPKSETGIPGVHILHGSDGVDRVYSHHSGDPLAPGNLPSWCGVKAVDAVDVAMILGGYGDRKKGLHALATKFGLSTASKSPRRPDPPPAAEGDYGSTRPKPQRAGPKPNGDASRPPGGNGHASDGDEQPHAGARRETDDEPPPGAFDEPPEDEPAETGPAKPKQKTAEEMLAEINAGIRATVNELNRRYMVVSEAGKAVIYQPGQDTALKRRHFARLTTRDLQTFYMNDRIQVGFNQAGFPIYKTKADVWLNHRDRRQFIHGVVFDPSGAALDDGVLNLWQGFAVQPEQGDWSIMRDHIKTNICGGDEEYDGYLLRWMARMVQHPAEQGEVAVVLKGKEGCGKGTLAKALLHILGQHALGISHAKHLTGAFNGHLRDCVFLFADEAFYAGDKQHVGVLKSLITEPILTIEAKHQNAIQAANMLHVLMASNEEWVVPASLDARRFFVLSVSDLVAGDHRYFGELWAQMEAGGYAAMLHDLLAHDLAGFNVRAVPTTAALQQQRKMSLPIPEAWWMDCLHRGYVFRSKLGLEDFFAEWRDDVSTELLFASYTEFANQRHERHLMTREAMGGFLVDDMGCQHKRLTNAATGEHMAEELGSFGRAPKVITQYRPPGFSLGKLDEARADFTESTKLPIEWDPPDQTG